MNNPIISIVIPCKNEEKYIEKCINSFLNINSNNIKNDQIEILICDGMSTDRTREIIKSISEKYPQVKVLDNTKQKTPFALNLGINNAKGEYVLIASAHSSFDSNYIDVLMDQMQQLKADVIGGVMVTKVLNKNKKTNSIIKVLSHKLGVGNASFRVGVDKPKRVDTVPFGLYKLELLKSVGGYDNRLIRNHDIELSKRLLFKNAKIFLTPDTKCYYYARENLLDIAKNNYRNGKWNLKTVFITKNFSSLSLRHFIPLAFLLSLTLPVILSFFIHPKLAYLSVAIFIIYLLVVISVSIQIKLSDKNTSILYLILSFITLHLSYGLGSLLGLFSFFDLYGKFNRTSV